jgi:hypothetical protein
VAKPLIRFGDKISHGGSVIEASPHSDIDGVGIARMGDKASCSKHGTVTIASGDSTLIIDGKTCREGRRQDFLRRCPDRWSTEHYRQGLIESDANKSCPAYACARRTRLAQVRLPGHICSLSHAGAARSGTGARPKGIPKRETCYSTCLDCRPACCWCFSLAASCLPELLSLLPRLALPTAAKAIATSAASTPLAILAASLRLPHGASPEELASAIAGNKARPDLDRELVDDDGFPVMTARSSEAVDEALQEEITEWLALNGMAELHFNDEQWRAVTLASAVVAELAAQAAGPMLYQVDPQTKLQLFPSLPTEWDSAHRRATNLWLKQTVARYGWPADRVIVTTDEAMSADDMTPSAVVQTTCSRRCVDECAIDRNGRGMRFPCRRRNDRSMGCRRVTCSRHRSPKGGFLGKGQQGLLLTNQAPKLGRNRDYCAAGMGSRKHIEIPPQTRLNVAIPGYLGSCLNARSSTVALTLPMWRC